ncbi:hypothetical protein RIF29_22039 [Crotalaria pallida]|uniref:MI domain-containing protein n=1 Tax=Crotalaria pallida TaxID=3830 RepID=A0AAN9F6E3_CROPI
MVTGITTANMLKEVIRILFNKAVKDPTLCSMYSQLLCDLNSKLPPLPTDKPGDQEITVKRVLLKIVCEKGLRRLEEPIMNLEIIRFVVEQLISPACCPEIVMESIILALNKSPPQVKEAADFVGILITDGILSDWDIKRGCLLFAGSMVDRGTTVDLLEAPSNFGEMIGKLVLAGCLDFNAVREILKKVHSDRFRLVIIENVVKKVVQAEPSAADENVEALCEFFNTIGKQVDGSPKSSRLINDMHFKGDQMMVTGITTASMLKEVVIVIFNKAVEDPTLCHTYSQLLCDLNSKLPQLPSEQQRVGQEITVKSVLSNILPTVLKKPMINLEIIRFVGELWKQDMVPLNVLDDVMRRICEHCNPSDESVEALCDLFYNKNMRFGENRILINFLWCAKKNYSNHLEELRTNPEIAPRVRFRVHDVLLLFANSPFRCAVLDAESYTDDDHRKIVSFLEKYFSPSGLDNVVDEFLEELIDPACYPEIVLESIILAQNKSPPQVKAAVDFLQLLITEEILSDLDIKRGCLLFAGSMVDCDTARDLPEAPSNFGHIIGKLVLAGGLNFKAVREILNKVHSDKFRCVIMENAAKVISLNDLTAFLSY